MASSSTSLQALDITKNAQLRNSLPNPSTEAFVLNASPDTDVYILRGSRLSSAKKMLTTGCVRGDAPDPNCGAPTDSEVKKQVGGPQGGAIEKLPEFTTDMKVATTFATDCIVLIRIARKYLTNGSGSESGWACYGAAPCKLIGFIPTKPKSFVSSTGKKLIAD